MFVPHGTFQQGLGPGDPCTEVTEPPFTHTLTQDIAVMATEVTRRGIVGGSEGAATDAAYGSD